MNTRELAQRLDDIVRNRLACSSAGLTSDAGDVCMFLGKYCGRIGVTGSVTGNVTSVTSAFGFQHLQLAKAWVKHGAKPDLTYDPEAVNDYTDETPTGQWLTMRAA